MVVLDNINVTFKRGTITTVIGKSGVGKSVLLKHIIGLIEPDSGDILYSGRTIASMTELEKITLSSKFSYMFQHMALFDSMTIFENIALPLQENKKFPNSDIEMRVMEKMHQLELNDIGYKYPSQISGGMQKRVALARALITDPEIILFDEPTTGLDPIRKNAVFNLIADNQKQFGYTAIIVSHAIPDIFYISDQIAMLDNARILYHGSPEIIYQCQKQEVQEFIRGTEALKNKRHAMAVGM